jgi:RNA polymerase sigma factor (sigma-70 family)
VRRGFGLGVVFVAEVLTMNPVIDDCNTLAEQNLGLARYIANRIAKSRSYGDVDQLISVAYEALVNASRTFEAGKGKFGDYAGRLIEWRCSMEITRQFRRTMPSIYSKEDFTIEPSACTDYETGVDIVLMKQAITKLKPKYQELLARMMQGYTFAEISREWKVSKNAVRIQYLRAIECVRKILCNEIPCKGRAGSPASLGVLSGNAAGVRRAKHKLQ